eukprot:scaffold83419_cov29-Attheya_sp.AAC.1
MDTEARDADDANPNPENNDQETNDQVDVEAPTNDGDENPDADDDESYEEEKFEENANVSIDSNELDDVLIGDFFTKPLQGSQFRTFRDMIMNNVVEIMPKS